MRSRTITHLLVTSLHFLLRHITVPAMFMTWKPFEGRRASLLIFTWSSSLFVAKATNDAGFHSMLEALHCSKVHHSTLPSKTTGTVIWKVCWYPPHSQGRRSHINAIASFVEPMNMLSKRF